MKKLKLPVFVWCTIAWFCLISVAYGASSSETILPDEQGTTPAVKYPYFPGRQYAFVWRNWSVVPEERLAEVLDTDVEHVRKLASSMGLPTQQDIEPQWSTSWGYITVLRRNWHLLPYEQLLTLLGISKEELAWRLIEDDFLFVKLGYKKPYCQPLRYEEPTDEMVRQAAELKKIVRKEFGKGHEVPRFAFMEEFAEPIVEVTSTTDGVQSDDFALRLIYPYCAAFGDPLMDPELSSYPEGLLQRLAAKGVNGIWMHSVLNKLVPPDGIFPGAEDASQRIAGLKRLVDRAAKYGIGIYLYMNEPRAMPRTFFDDSLRQQLMGAPEGEQRALCTSAPGVLPWVERSVERVFREVPGLGGVFTITASENLTNCASRGGQQSCERCRNRSYADLIVEVNQAITAGVKRAAPDAKVLVWDWGWNDAYAEEIISRLPKSCWLMSVSEWSLPIERGGVSTAVGEYALSAVGPGPRALSHWEMAKKAGLKTVAKVQVNASWEMAVVPSVPVLDLVARHAKNLAAVSTDGVMLSWSLGGYPSVSLELFESSMANGEEQALSHLAGKYYGAEAAPLVRRAWKLFSDAFEEFPYHGLTLYGGPQHMGPANPFYTEPTGWPASMVGIPYDALDSWRSVYPPEVFIGQMERVAEGFEQGCELLEQAIREVRGEQKQQLTTDLGRARAVAIHCASSANQARFVDARNRMTAAKSPEERKACLATMRQTVQQEREVTERLLPIVRRDATIGYESSNHYFYIPQDLIEKQINLHYVDRWLDRQEEELDQL